MELGRKAQAVDELRPIPRSSVSDAIVDQLIDLITREVLKPGDRLPSERELCKRFGVGRTSVREALRSLAVMGILDGRVGDGTFVSDNRRYLERTLQWGLLLDPKKVDDLIETRLMLESNTACWAAERAVEENLTQMRGSLDGMERSIGELERFLEFDLQFHLEIALASHNSILHNLVSMTRGYLQEWIEGSLKTPSSAATERARLSVSQHRSIVAAIADRDGDLARREMSGHILSSSRDLRDHIGVDSDNDSDNG